MRRRGWLLYPTAPPKISELNICFSLPLLLSVFFFFFLSPFPASTIHTIFWVSLLIYLLHCKILFTDYVLFDLKHQGFLIQVSVYAWRSGDFHLPSLEPSSGFSQRRNTSTIWRHPNLTCKTISHYTVVQSRSFLQSNRKSSSLSSHCWSDISTEFSTFIRARAFFQTNPINPGAFALFFTTNSQVGGDSLHFVLFHLPSFGPKV